MEYVKRGLISLFDDMMTQLDNFEKKTYKSAFDEGYKKYEPMLLKFSSDLDQMQEAEKEVVVEELAAVLPDYAKQELKKVFFLNRSRQSMEYNMNMVLYIIPTLMNCEDKNCERLAKRIVELWNEKKVVSMTLQLSTFEEIAAGFTDTFMGIPINRKQE